MPREQPRFKPLRFGKVRSPPEMRQRQMVKKTGEGFAAEWARKFVSDKIGSSTTHWDKLRVRLERGVGNPCPLPLIGIPATVVSTEKME